MNNYIEKNNKKPCCKKDCALQRIILKILYLKKIIFIKLYLKKLC